MIVDEQKNENTQMLLAYMLNTEKNCIPFSHRMSPSVMDSAKGGHITVFISPPKVHNKIP